MISFFVHILGLPNGKMHHKFWIYQQKKIPKKQLVWAKKVIWNGEKERNFQWKSFFLVESLFVMIYCNCKFRKNVFLLYWPSYKIFFYWPAFFILSTPKKYKNSKSNQFVFSFQVINATFFLSDFLIFFFPH